MKFYRYLPIYFLLFGLALIRIVIVRCKKCGNRIIILLDGENYGKKKHKSCYKEKR